MPDGFLQILRERGFLRQCTDPEGLEARLGKGPVTGYVGFDCTAPSLHVGSLIQILALRWLQETGNRPLVLLGDGTTRIGDPSGRDQLRKVLSPEEIYRNTTGIQKIFGKILDLKKTTFMRNSEWLGSLNLLDFLQDSGRHFPVGRMLGSESVRRRLEDPKSGLSLLEFCYPVLQALDFSMLAEKHDCCLQIGGSDQYGNICAGIDLARRTRNLTLFGLTTELAVTSDGIKMGKTASGAVWLDPELCSPYEFWQYWRNTSDADTDRFLKLFTLLPLDEIARLEALSGEELNQAKEILAHEVTSLVHSPEEAMTAQETARNVFQEKPESGIPGSGLQQILLPRSEFRNGIPLVQALVRTGLAESANQAKRLIASGGARVNGVQAESLTRSLGEDDLQIEGYLKLSAGRKRHALILAEIEAP